jgi:hypothetical protein
VDFPALALYFLTLAPDLLILALDLLVLALDLLLQTGHQLPELLRRQLLGVGR